MALEVVFSVFLRPVQQRVYACFASHSRSCHIQCGPMRFVSGDLMVCIKVGFPELNGLYSSDVFGGRAEHTGLKAIPLTQALLETIRPGKRKPLSIVTNSPGTPDIFIIRGKSAESFPKLMRACMPSPCSAAASRIIPTDWSS